MSKAKELLKIMSCTSKQGIPLCMEELNARRLEVDLPKLSNDDFIVEGFEDVARYAAGISLSKTGYNVYYEEKNEREGSGTKT